MSGIVLLCSKESAESDAVRSLKLRTTVRLFLVMLLFSCRHAQRELPFYNTPDFTPVWVGAQQSPASLIQHRVGNFSFTNQEGKTIDQQTIKNKIHVANFMFTTCSSICPVMVANMHKVQQAFVADSSIVLLSYSVTPWIDSVPRLNKYATRMNIQSNQWHLLTGGTDEIYQLARQGYFAEEETGFKKDSSEFLHTEHFMLVDRNGYLRGIYNGTVALEMERLIGDIRSLLKE
jgi:protein SCO1